MRILHLTLKKKWFDLILSGAKTREYREDKPYWSTRLVNPLTEEGKVFDIVRFKNGYGKNDPTMDVEFRSISFTSSQYCKGEHGEEIWYNTIVIFLGKVLRTKIYNKHGAYKEIIYR